MVLNLAVGLLLLLVFRDGWSELLSFNSGAIVLSMCLGPVTVVALRRQVPDRVRPFRLRGLAVLARVVDVPYPVTLVAEGRLEAQQRVDMLLTNWTVALSNTCLALAIAAAALAFLAWMLRLFRRRGYVTRYS